MNKPKIQLILIESGIVSLLSETVGKMTKNPQISAKVRDYSLGKEHGETSIQSYKSGCITGSQFAIYQTWFMHKIV